ncbi:MAG TPA: hypothetical protein VN408_06745 [Actinoplanes sp.]|nr:hypothetical protein [Actinoplanes sp.]
MTTSANSVITAIDLRRPGLALARGHLLLFFAQGHHLAWCGQPLFDDPLYATAQGVAVDASDGTATPISTEAQAGTIGDILARYGALSPADLRTLIQASDPWRSARKNGGLVDHNELTDWFRRPDETDDPGSGRPTPAECAAAEAYLTSRTMT